MLVEKVNLSNFRCISGLSLALPEGLGVVTGPNASGKTSLLESIFVASAGRSHRTRKDAELVQWGKARAQAEVQFVDGAGRRLPVRIDIDLSRGVRKSITLAGKRIRRGAELMNRIAVVMFGPSDLQLAHAEPAVRRRFMNLALARIRPAYAADLARYKRALVQRNRLLKEQAAPEQIESWTRQLIRAGAQVAAARRWFAEKIAGPAAEIHETLSSGVEQLEVQYSGDLAEANDAEQAERLYAERIAHVVEEERTLGRTLVGPHRDDLILSIDGRPLRRFGSRGQQRTAAIALKLAEASLLQRISGESPVLLLDDLLSELDEKRASQVLGLTKAYGQLIVTCAALEPALQKADVARWIYLAGGEVTKIE